MAHNINQNRMFYYGEKPWHDVGVELNHPATAKEAIEVAGLDYEVQPQEIFLKDGRNFPGYRALVRMDNGDPIGYASDKYKVVQNNEAFGFFDSLVGEKLAMYHTAGALGKGERIWILAKLPNDIIVTKDDVVEKYLCLTNSHDGKSSLRMYFTPIRVVCQNTLNASMNGAVGEGVCIRHTGNIGGKVDEARKALGLAVNFYAKFSESVSQMVIHKMTDKELEAYFNYALRGEGAEEKEATTKFTNERDVLMSLFTNGKGNSEQAVRGSLWAAYNAVTEYVDHKRTVKNLSADKSNRLKSIWFGSGSRIKARSYDKAVELVSVK